MYILDVPSLLLWFDIPAYFNQQLIVYDIFLSVIRRGRGFALY